MLNHIALTSGSEYKSDRFFRDLLGLEKLVVKTINGELSLQVFDIKKDFTAIEYAGQGLKFEIFITQVDPPEIDPIGHLCLEIKDIQAFLGRASTMGIEIRRVVKNEKTLFFIKDFDGHLYELKGK